MDYFLEVTEGPDKGKTFPLSGSSVIIGRDPGQCNLVISDQVVSRTHAQVKHSPGDIFHIEDLGSTHGTLLNGNPVKEAALFTRSDRITIGKSVIELKSGTAAGPLAQGDSREPADQKKGLFRKELLLPLILLVALASTAVILIVMAQGGESRRAGPLDLTDEGSYLRFRSETHANLVTSFSSFESLAGNPLGTPEWERSLKVTIAAIKVICEEIQYAQPPEKHRLSHNYLQAAASDYSRAMDAFMARNPGQMRQHLASGDTNYAEAVRMLQFQQ